VEDSLNWLYNCSGPWSFVEENWILVAVNRMKTQISKDGQTISSYMAENAA
jgi:hypothetical protein